MTLKTYHITSSWDNFIAYLEKNIYVDIPKYFGIKHHGEDIYIKGHRGPMLVLKELLNCAFEIHECDDSEICKKTDWIYFGDPHFFQNK